MTNAFPWRVLTKFSPAINNASIGMSEVKRYRPCGPPKFPVPAQTNAAIFTRKAKANKNHMLLAAMADCRRMALSQPITAATTNPM